MSMAPPRKTRPQTAAEKLDALAALRLAQGLIVQPPVLPSVDGTQPKHIQLSQQEERSRVFLGWLREVAQKGSMQDVDAAFAHFQDVHLRRSVQNQVDALRLQADRNHCQLVHAAHLEAKAEQTAWNRRHRAAMLKKDNEALAKKMADNERLIAELST